MVNLEKWLIYLSNCCGHVGESIQFDVPPPPRYLFGFE